MTAVTVIRRSLREHDNTALVKASEEHDEVVPLYVVDDSYFEQAELGYPRMKFWHDSLKELKQDLSEKDGRQLVVRRGDPAEEIQKVVDETDADAVYHNRDYRPYSKERDQRVADELEVPVKSFKDIVMFEKEEILTNSGTPYKVYSYYKKKWFKKDKRRPQKVKDYSTPDLDSVEIPSISELGFEKPEDMNVWDGGRENGLQRMKQFKENIREYDQARDYAWKDSTSKLSPHLKFGTVSIVRFSGKRRE